MREAVTPMHDAELRADVCIIGAGPAGLTVAAELMGSGLHVLVVEAGSRRVLPGGEPYTSSGSVGLRYPLAGSRVRGVGGSAHHWDVETPCGGPRVRLRELDDLDFEDRPGVRTPGWPFSRTQLEPYYRRARALLALQPAAADDDGPLPSATDGAETQNGVWQRLFSFSPASTFTDDLPSRLEADPHTTVVGDAVIIELHTAGAGGPVTTAVARTRGGSPFTVRARMYVLAGGGIENPRLLLASRGTSAPGLGNRHDHVGRWFQEHVHYQSGLIVPADGSLFVRTDAWGVVSREGHPVQRKYGLSQEALRREGLLNIAYWLTPRPARWLVPMSRTGEGAARGLLAARHMKGMLTTRKWSPGGARDLADLTWSVPLMGVYAWRQHLAQLQSRKGNSPRYPLVFTLGAMAEPVPQADSRVRLGTALDRYGVPHAELDCRLGDADAEAMRRTHDLVAPALARAFGARVVPLLPPDELPSMAWGYHHMGTTRMSWRPQDGVVDPDLRVHDVPNLLVVGSSVFPSSGSANPTLTIVALAIRAADLLRRELRLATIDTDAGRAARPAVGP